MPGVTEILIVKTVDFIAVFSTTYEKLSLGKKCSCKALLVFVCLEVHKHQNWNKIV